MEFKFAHYTEVTDLAFRVNDQYEESNYTRVFICPDVKDAHLIRVLPGYGHDYEKNENAIIVEYEKIPNRFKGEKMGIMRAKRILKGDDFSNWDYHVFSSMDKVIESLQDGFEILNLKSES